MEPSTARTNYFVAITTVQCIAVGVGVEPFAATTVEPLSIFTTTAKVQWVAILSNPQQFLSIARL